MHFVTCIDYVSSSHGFYFILYFIHTFSSCSSVKMQASDDNGIGQTSVVSLRISLLDANDSPPVCESPLYRASIDEGATTFDPPLILKARDPDTVSEMRYR